MVILQLFDGFYYRVTKKPSIQSYNSYSKMKRKLEILPIWHSTYTLQDLRKLQGNTELIFRYLIPIDLPPEAMASQEISNLWSEYQLILNEFKEAHRGHTDSRKESHQFKELKNDIGIIDVEKENGNGVLEFIGNHNFLRVYSDSWGAATLKLSIILNHLHPHLPYFSLSF